MMIPAATNRMMKLRSESVSVTRIKAHNAAITNSDIHMNSAGLF